MKAIEDKSIYNTNNFALNWDNSLERFSLSMFADKIEINICGLIALKKKIKDIDISKHFTSDHTGIEIIQLHYCDRMFVFNTLEILELKELLDGSFTMLELNSLIHKSIIRKTF